MKFFSPLLAAAFLQLTFAGLLAGETKFTFDPAHSSISFKVGHFFGKVPGHFAQFEGEILIDEAAPESAKVEATIKVPSISTANADRDKHLLSPDFFHAEKHPAITFKSKGVKKTGERSADVTGDLTMNGVTKEIVLPIEFKGKLPDMFKPELTRTAWEGSVELNRKDFGLTWNKMVEGVGAVGEKVEVELHIEAVGKP